MPLATTATTMPDPSAPARRADPAGSIVSMISLATAGNIHLPAGGPCVLHPVGLEDGRRTPDGRWPRGRTLDSELGTQVTTESFPVSSQLQRPVLDQPDAGRVELRLLRAWLDWCRFLCLQHVGERASRSLQALAEAHDLRAIHGDFWRELLVVPRLQQGQPRHHQPEPRAVHAGLPRALVVHDLAGLIHVHVLAEVEDRIRSPADREVIA